MSADGVPIHYRSAGRGALAVVFVHGWLGSSAWWEPLLLRLASHHRTVAIDLAGHGRSGRGRRDWSVEAFAGDIRAVVNALNLDRVVLVAHSMAGPIAVQAARALGPRVVLIVPVDTMKDVEWDLSPAAWNRFVGELRQDFRTAVEDFFRNVLFVTASPRDVVARVVAEGRSADPGIAVSILDRGRAFDVKAALRSLAVPIHAINSDAGPTAIQTNRQYAPQFEASIMEGVGHWPMLEAPGRFGDLLEAIIDQQVTLPKAIALGEKPLHGRGRHRVGGAFGSPSLPAYCSSANRPVFAGGDEPPPQSEADTRRD